MNEKLTPEQIVSQIESSFPGYTVVAEIWDYRFRFRFQVRSAKENSILLTVPDRLIHEFDAKPQLDQLIAQARERIDKRQTPVL